MEDATSYTVTYGAHQNSKKQAACSIALVVALLCLIAAHCRTQNKPLVAPSLMLSMPRETATLKSSGPLFAAGAALLRMEAKAKMFTNSHEKLITTAGAVVIKDQPEQSALKDTSVHTEPFHSAAESVLPFPSTPWSAANDWQDRKIAVQRFSQFFSYITFRSTPIEIDMTEYSSRTVTNSMHVFVRIILSN